SSFGEDGTRRSGLRSWAALTSGATPTTTKTAIASQRCGNRMFNGEDIGTMRIRTRSDISPRSRQMKGARAYGTNPALTPKLARPFRVAEAPGAASHWQIRRRRLASRYAAIYAAAFSTGGIVMGIEMLGSRYLNPYFGSGIYTWAALIFTVLVALMAGYFLGGTLADRTPSTVVLAL